MTLTEMWLKQGRPMPPFIVVYAKALGQDVIKSITIHSAGTESEPTIYFKDDHDMTFDGNAHEVAEIVLMRDE